MNKCPLCGSTDLELHTVEEKDKIIWKGLPVYYVKDGWEYYVCARCFEKAKGNNFRADFVCAFPSGQPYEFLGGNNIWVPIGKPDKEVVQFT